MIRLLAYRFLRRPIRRGFQSFRSLKADSGFHCRSALVSVVFVDEKMAVKKKKQIRVIVSTIMQGPLNIWTEHSNCQIHSRGDSKTLIALLMPNIFLIFFMKLFFYTYKS